MPRPRPPYLLKERNRHGATVWYVRVGTGPRIRIRGAYGTAGFMADYAQAVATATQQNARRPQKRPGVPDGTLRWLVALYMESSAWRGLSGATRRQRGNILKTVLESAGDYPLADIDRPAIVDGRERRSATPAAARHFIETMRALYRWAVEAGHADHDPTQGVSSPRKSGDGFKAWTMDDVAAWRARWPLGTQQRLWLELLLGTGLRRGDAARIGADHVKHGVATLTTEKTGTEVYFRIPDPLRATIEAAGRTSQTPWAAGAGGRPLTKESFGNLFRKAARQAGIDKSAHGLRKLAATIDAENGATEAQLMAKFGWTDFRMAAQYTRAANRRKLALQIR